MGLLKLKMKKNYNRVKNEYSKKKYIKIYCTIKTVKYLSSQSEKLYWTEKIKVTECYLGIDTWICSLLNGIIINIVNNLELK